MKQQAFKILNSKFGEKAQIIKCIEELSELQQVLCHWLNRDVNDGSHMDIDYEKIASEFADAEITTGFVIKILSKYYNSKMVTFEDLIESEKEFKLRKVIDKFS